jgi:zinc transport system permease protein
VLNITAPVAALGVCLGVAGLFAWLERRANVASDTLLAVIAHGSLAAGVIAVSLLPPRGGSLESLLFGELLAVGDAQLQLISGVGLVVALIAARYWRDWLAIAVDEDLARIEGVAVERARLLQLLCIAALIGVAMNVVGVLLVTALLIVPPAAARALSRSPEQMAALGAVLGALAVLAGLWLSLEADTPAGPSVVAGACLLFALCHGAAALRQR